MTIKKFSDVFIRQVSCNKDSMVYRDSVTTGLCLWVSHTGKKTFSHLYTIYGKQRRMTIGDYPIISLKQSGDIVAKNKAKILDNIDPNQDLAICHMHNKSNNLTVQSEFNIFIKEHAVPKLKTYKAYIRIFHNHIAENIKNTPIESLMRAELRSMLNYVGITSGEATSNKLCCIVKSAFMWLWNYEYITHNPIIMLPLPFKKKSRNRVLSDAGIAVLNKCTYHSAYVF